MPCVSRQLSNRPSYIVRSEILGHILGLYHQNHVFFFIQILDFRVELHVEAVQQQCQRDTSFAVRQISADAVPWTGVERLQNLSVVEMKFSFWVPVDLFVPSRAKVFFWPVEVALL